MLAWLERPGCGKSLSEATALGGKAGQQQRGETEGGQRDPGRIRHAPIIAFFASALKEQSQGAFESGAWRPVLTAQWGLRTIPVLGHLRGRPVFETGTVT